ncbi:MAG: tRNA dihydrouridine synthase DusB [Firmicutes bacterium]|nr:tRNA dihydrouridine synthase DusB [Bacillota bacterium]
MRIGNMELKGRLSLAPMAGVTDLAFRSVCMAAGAALCCTEMVSAKALVYKDAKTRALLRVSADEHPVGAQIFGSEPAVMGEAAGLALELSGADFIDINMGCPVGKIAGNGDGSALMRDPDLAARIVEAVVKSVPVPVTVKMRKGWDSGSVNAVEIARLCEAAGASAVAVHGRTRAQIYAGVADWDIIRAVKAALKIPVFANGDVFEPEDAVRILNYTGADCAMVGRGAFGNPWLFTRGNAAIAGQPIPPLPPLRARMDVARRQLELAAETKGEKIACLEARRHLAWYLKGVPYAGYYKKQIAELGTLEQGQRIIEGIQRDLR